MKAQRDFFRSGRRFNCVPAGRRSGKSMTKKVRAFRRSFQIPYDDGRVVLAAPTHKQARDIFWRDALKLWRPFAVDVKTGTMEIILVNGVKVQVCGMDVPQRAEGSPLDHIVLDEYADMRPEVWGDHVFPMLAERGGTADVGGTPEGRNHFYDLWTEAQGDVDWGCFTWSAEEVLDGAEVARLKRMLDAKTYDQEIRASFVNFAGRAYYAFERELHVAPTAYDPSDVLALAFDFNVEPGVAAVIQEHPEHGTQVIDEVYIPRDSNTPRVCRELRDKIKGHKGEVHIYGDASGGARGSAKVQGSDWALVRREFPDAKWRVPSRNPPERSRINAMNSRVQTLFRVDPKCKYVIRDFEGVTRDDDGSIVKKGGDPLTHISDAIGYYVVRRYPVETVLTTRSSY